MISEHNGLITRQLNCMQINQASSLYYNNNNPVLKGIYFKNYFHTYILKTMKNCIINLRQKYKLVRNEF
jgi:hypothetical protein